jgi:hypothetical protein
VPVSEKASADTALFFAIHYGFFHFMFGCSCSHWPAVGGGLEVDRHRRHRVCRAARLAQRARLAADEPCDINLGAMLFLPYIRVLPIALGIGVVGYLHDSRRHCCARSGC